MTLQVTQAEFCAVVQRVYTQAMQLPRAQVIPRPANAPALGPGNPEMTVGFVIDAVHPSSCITPGGEVLDAAENFADMVYIETKLRAALSGSMAPKVGIAVAAVLLVGGLGGVLWWGSR